MTADARREAIEQAATELFAERGYLGTSMDEVARCSGISAAVVYDHFASKQDLHRRLLERHFAQLRAVWEQSWGTDRHGEEPIEQRAARSFEAWFAYVQGHPYAWRMLFRDTSGEPSVQDIHRQVIAESRAALLPLLARQLHQSGVRRDDPSVEMAWEALRGTLQGLALWWYEHPDVAREDVVQASMNACWLGLERVLRGEAWTPSTTPEAEGHSDNHA